MVSRQVLERRETVEKISTSAIEVRDLRQSYGDFEAVKGISFQVREGELFALLGTNGAGKTTTIEILEGFRAPTAGSVSVLGLDPYTKRAQVRPHTGLMLQEGGFFTDLTVAETVRFWRDVSPRKPYSLSEILGRVELEEKAGVQVRQLSGGQKRRLDLALATLAQPKVLFLDEPTTGMDPEARRNTWTLIQELVAAGTTVLLTTHYLEEAERLADRLAIMHNGRIELAGTISEVVAQRGNRIRFKVPEHLPVDRLPRLEGVAPTVEVRKTEAHAEYRLGADPASTQQSLARLISWASENSFVLERLEVRSASLEDVFLEVAHAA
ncbi:multidrug ABC transporter ATP-binding protein [Microtetraspora sp. NBRC 13810]|uniref:ABC transporter ATP-binding protein n=1 Tax=Microtetraspora sp. NBRC 13810 TaxID=3030990 RepID=UPI0024A52D91|nr:ABC transporter ATP-binding protein [Microtetraspora sp. NBRC 13810]GLW09872.1 multidrug ABC transporter ATP-binding protein [Microtetraspora sp. NBRC 13810]